ncbi:MAG: helix-turn-helix domain-containing protein, partial [Lachnospiraceae bacterium]|nr:helix-turn-helix domain-containing protein [Lachnospiraceae bacterium]
NIKKARKQKGYTQDKLAELLGFEKGATVSAWERNVNIPSSETIEAMAKLFKCDPAYLTGAQDCLVKEYNERSKYTGLSDKAIEILHNASTSDPKLCDIISDIIENGEILQLIKEARQAANIANCVDILSDEMEKEKQLRELKAWESLRKFMGDING